VKNNNPDLSLLAFATLISRKDGVRAEQTKKIDSIPGVKRLPAPQPENPRPPEQGVKVALKCTLLMAVLLAGSAVQSEPIAKVSCMMKNVGVVSYDGKSGNSSAGDDWYTDCTITVGDRKIYSKALIVGHPASLRDAMNAVEEFRKKAPEIVHENR